MYWWLFMLAFPCACVAWNGDGHRIAAKIAAVRIRTKTRRFVKEHLGILSPGRKHYALMTYYSTWADSVEWSSDLHFVSLRGNTCDGFDMDRDCGSDPSRRCLVTAIGNYTERASDVELDSLERAEAIQFLLHFVADSHQPLHTGFASDRGGTSIHLVDPEDHSLHEVWDSYLISRISGDWRALANQLIQSSEGSLVEFPIIDERNPIEWASDVVSETIRTHTCVSAYENELGLRISSGASLSEEYINSRLPVVRGQLLKAGMRLADLLDHIAAEYYRKEHWKTFTQEIGVVAVDRTSSNRFEVLQVDMDFDLEELAFELESPSDSEEEIEESCMEKAPVDETAPAVTEIVPTLSPEERKRLQNKKKAERKKVNKRKLFGVDVESIVLIKRAKYFYITYRKLVTSDTFKPEGFIVVKVQFTGQENIVPFMLDTDVFQGGVPPAELLHAVFRKLRGIEASTEATMNTPEIGQVDSFSVIGGPDPVRRAAVEEQVRESTDLLLGMGLIPQTDYTSTDLSRVRDMIAPTPSKAELRRIYGSVIPSRDQVMWDEVHRLTEDIVALKVNDVLLISRKEYLKDKSNRRWVFNKESLVDSSISWDSFYELFIDARIVDGALPMPLIRELNRIGGQLKNRRALRDILKSGCRIIDALSVVGNMQGTGNMVATLQMIAVFEATRPVIRSDGVDTIEYVLRTPEDERRIRSLFPFVPEIAPVRSSDIRSI